jgi:hypothetical protein
MSLLDEADTPSWKTATIARLPTAADEISGSGTTTTCMKEFE